MHPKDAYGMAHIVDPDPAAAWAAFWSGSALFAQTCMSENFKSLLYYFQQMSTNWAFTAYNKGSAVAQW